MRVGVVSLKGSPGATTLITLLAAVWPQTRRVVIEADPDGSTLLPRYATALRPEPNVATLAAACRHGIDEEALWRNTQRLFGSVDVIIGADSPAVTERSLSDLLPYLGDLSASLPGVALFWDLGRLRNASLASELSRNLDLTIVAVQPNFESVEPLLKRAVEIDGLHSRVGIVVIGDGAIAPAEIHATIGARTGGRIGVLGAVPAASRDAQRWNAAPGAVPALMSKRRFTQSRLVGATRAICAQIDTTISMQVQR